MNEQTMGTMLQDFINLIERYEPNYSQSIQGATPEEIHQLEQEVGLPLPRCYREFLGLMGKDMGELQLEGVVFQIDRIFDFYSRGHWAPPRGYILFGIQDEDPCLDYFLECATPGAADCPVVRFPSEGEFSKDRYYYPLDPSLNDFLLSLAFSEKRMASFSAERVFTPSTRKTQAPGLVTSPAEIVRLIDQRAHHLGFERVAPSSTVYRFYDQKDAAIYIRFDEADGNLAVTLAAQRARELERIGDILCNGTSLVMT